METAAPVSEVKSLAASGASWSLAKLLQCRLCVEIPVPAFTVRDLLCLEQNGIVETLVPEGAVVPVHANGQTIARGEFEVMGDRLAVRLIELN